MKCKKSLKYLFLITILPFISCNTENLSAVGRPDPFLNRQEMASVLTDIQLAEAGVQLQNLPPDSANRFYDAYYDFIYKKHKISASEFVANYQYYLGYPPEMDSVYQDVLKNLEILEAKSRGVYKPADSSPLPAQQ